MNRGFLSASILLALLLSVLIFVGDRTRRAAEVWSDDFNDRNYDGWTVFALDFTTEPPTQLAANYSAADGTLQDIGPQPDRIVWSYAVHNSSVAYGTWSFDVNAVDTPSHLFYVSFTTLDPIVLNGYDLAIAVGRGLGSGPDRLIDRESALFKRVNGRAFRLGRYAVPGGITGWQHIDITRDTSGQFYVYVNGTLRTKAIDIQHTASKYFMFGSEVGPALDNVVVSDTVDIRPASTTTATTITIPTSVMTSATTPPASTTTATPTETATYTTPTAMTTTPQSGPAAIDLILGVAAIATMIVLLAVFIAMRSRLFSSGRRHQIDRTQTSAHEMPGSSQSINQPLGGNPYLSDPWMTESVPMSEKHPSPIIPIAISILAFIGWCIFILWHTLFWSGNFTLFQNIVIGLISLLILGALLGLMWVIWGFRAAGWRMPRPGPA